MSTRLPLPLPPCALALSVLMLARSAGAQPPAQAGQGGPPSGIFAAGLSYDTGHLPRELQRACPNAETFSSDVVTALGYPPFELETKRRALEGMSTTFAAEVAIAAPFAVAAVAVAQLAIDTAAPPVTGVPAGRFEVVLTRERIEGRGSTLVARVTFEDALGVREERVLYADSATREGCAKLGDMMVEVVRGRLRGLARKAAAALPPPALPRSPQQERAPAVPPSSQELPPEDPPPPAPPPPTPWAFRFGFEVLADRAASTSFGPGVVASLGFRYGAFSASPQVHWGAPATVNSVGQDSRATRLTWGVALCWHEEARAKLRGVACLVGEGGNIVVHAQTGDDSSSFRRAGLGPRAGVEVPFSLPGLPAGLFVHLGGEVLWGFGETQGNNHAVSVDHPRGTLGLGGGLLLEWPPRPVRQ